MDLIRCHNRTDHLPIFFPVTMYIPALQHSTSIPWYLFQLVEIPNDIMYGMLASYIRYRDRLK